MKLPQKTSADENKLHVHVNIIHSCRFSPHTTWLSKSINKRSKLIHNSSKKGIYLWSLNTPRGGASREENLLRRALLLNYAHFYLGLEIYRNGVHVQFRRECWKRIYRGFKHHDEFAIHFPLTNTVHYGNGTLLKCCCFWHLRKFENFASPHTLRHGNRRVHMERLRRRKFSSD